MSGKRRFDKQVQFRSKGAYYAFFAVLLLVCLVLSRIVSWLISMALGA